MKPIKGALLLVLATAVSGCVTNKVDKTVDNATDNGHLSNLTAGIWVDPNGCDHWIIDDGVEGYLSQRLDPYGKPVCSGAAPPGVATGPFKEGSSFGDPI
ncbi:hypothetical protein J7382_10600 [Shimia sp. R11_0]|uniref:hypothetical protein n=1 Tax=Shimia sp. R11_0 TaxID=2821096 RepID=UPI001ADC1773|nr:hypothetical protein [Shimia sp. R11_0]MBO9477985.1 hypothetical protein [Shimia sp. R11_0]